MTASLELLIKQFEEATFTYASAAAFIGTDQAYVRRLVGTGVLERCSVHGKPFVTARSVRAYVEEREHRAFEKALKEKEEKLPRWWAQGLDVNSKYARWNIHQLREECRDRGLSPWLNKALLVEELEKDDARTLALTASGPSSPSVDSD